MRRKKKQLNIFSMSALDLFASALGAFILLTLVLMPYYENVKKAPKSTANPKCEKPTKVPSCPVCPIIPEKKCPKVLPPTDTVEVKDNLLMATVQWYDMVDVDLVVYAPGGRKYFWGRNRYPGLDAHFIYDNYGDGRGRNRGRALLEIWKFYKPIAGNYRICGWLHKIHAHKPMDPTRVSFSLRLDKPTGVVQSRRQYFTHAGQEICPIKFSVSSDFKVTQLP